MRVASLFSGIGGFDLGFESAGMEVEAQVEIDAACQSVLQRHWPDARLFADVKEVHGSDLGAVDVVCGGFPCQDLSVAGRRAGLAGERSGLWYEYHRLLAEAHPEWVVIENVPGLLSSGGGRDFAIVLRGMVELGYGVAWRVLDAQYFGVPQRRRRVFIVGSLGDGRAAQVLFEPEGVRRDSATGREAGDGVAGSLMQGSSGSGGWQVGADEAAGHVVIAQNGSDIQVGTQLGTVSAGYARQTSGDALAFFSPRICRNSQSSNEVGIKDGGVADSLSTDGPGAIAFRTNQTGAQGPIHSVEIADTLAQDHPPAVAFNWQSGDDVRLGITEEGCGALHVGQVPAVQANGVRRLTPIECERLQGFPDGWTEGQSDSARYRMLGNAVAVPCAEWIGRRIMGVS